MRAWRCFIFFGLAVTLWADSKKVIKQTFHWHEATESQYVQGGKFRTEWDDGVNHTASISIPGVNYQLDLMRREYTEYVIPPPPPRPTPPKPVKINPNFFVDVYLETVDTGKRKEIFGQTAWYFIVRERRVPRSNTCGPETKTQTEGWYLMSAGRGGYVLTMGGPCGLAVFHGHRPAGTPIVEKQNGMTREMIELSEAPLDPLLFTVPPDFKKVDQLPQPETPWEEQLWWAWNRLLTRVQFF